MCQSAFNSIGYIRKPIDLSLTQAMTHPSAAHRADTVSEKILEALKANLRLEWMALPAAERFAAMCALTIAEKQALFAFAAAHGVQQQLSTDSDAIPAIEIAGARMNIAVEENWRPTAANYFGRVKKEMLLETARETVDHQWAHDHSGGKKADFAKTMELAFGPDGRQRLGIPADAAERTATWLPADMAFAGRDEPSVTGVGSIIAPPGSRYRDVRRGNRRQRGRAPGFPDGWWRQGACRRGRSARCPGLHRGELRRGIRPFRGRGRINPVPIPFHHAAG